MPLTSQTNETSRIIFEDLMTSSGTRGRKDTIERVREACDVLSAEGKTIGKQSVADTISRLHPGLPGGCAQYLRNKTNNGLRDYIDARERERKGAVKSLSVVATDSELDDIVKGMRDPDAALVVSELRARHKATERRLRRLTHLVETMRPGVDIDALVAGRPDTSARDGIQAIPEAALSALRSITALLSSGDTLASFHLARDPNGRIRRSPPNGRGPYDMMIPAETVLGLEQLAAILSGRGEQAGDNGHPCLPSP